MEAHLQCFVINSPCRKYCLLEPNIWEPRLERQGKKDVLRLTSRAMALDINGEKLEMI